MLYPLDYRKNAISASFPTLLAKFSYITVSNFFWLRTIF
jgi:hypothetical protein